MLKNQMAKPYAAALLDIGRSTNTLEFITDDIKNLLENLFDLRSAKSFNFLIN
jgi:F0F1-type ATP synthase delta subunit